ncbi:hypothetical protein L7F22_051293 [Adiantum nelumboides]|nr:hypothetical protein [Adiantum nelumboides]
MSNQRSASDHEGKPSILKRPTRRLKTKKRNYPLVRVIQMSPPTLVTTEPEHFRTVVQQLTGSPSSSLSLSTSLLASVASSCELSVPVSNVQANLTDMVSNYQAPFDIPHSLQNELPLQEGRLAEEEDDDDFVLLATDRDSNMEDNNNTTACHNYVHRLNISPSRAGHSQASNPDTSNYHDSFADYASTTSTMSCNGVASSSSRFSISACFEELEGLVDPFHEAQSDSKESRSAGDPAQSCCSYKSLCDHGGCQWDLDAIDSLFDGVDDVPAGRLPVLAASSYSSLQGYVSHINAAAATNYGDIYNGHCQLITS